jgi:hypothetical protein
MGSFCRMLFPRTHDKDGPIRTIRSLCWRAQVKFTRQTQPAVWPKNNTLQKRHVCRVTQARHKGKKARLPCDPGKTRGKDGPSAMWHVVVFWIFTPVLKFPVRRGLNSPCTRFRHTTNRAYVAFPLRRRKRVISFFYLQTLGKHTAKRVCRPDYRRQPFIVCTHTAKCLPCTKTVFAVSLPYTAAIQIPVVPIWACNVWLHELVDIRPAFATNFQNQSTTGS